MSTCNAKPRSLLFGVGAAFMLAAGLIAAPTAAFGSTHTSRSTAVTGAARTLAPSAVPAVITCAGPALSRGSTGTAVVILQKRIGANPDGIFGPVTDSTVRTFQRTHHLVVDGIVGPITWAALGGYPCATPDPTTTRATLTAAVGSYVKSRGNTVSVAIYDRRTGATWTYRPTSRYVNASIVKVQILATTLRQAQLQGRTLTAWQKSVATSMIRYSDNTSATTLWNAAGGAPAIALVDRELGLYDTTPNVKWGLTTTTASDQVILMRAVAYGTSKLNATNRAYMRYLMGSVTPSQRWGVSGGVPSGVTVQLKNGWLPLYPYGWRINSIGHVQGQSREYVIAILSSSNSSMDRGVTTANGISSIAWRTLATPLD